MSPSSLRLFQTASVVRHRWKATTTIHISCCCPHRSSSRLRLASTTTTTIPKSKRSSSDDNQFLIPGFQPTGKPSTFFEGDIPLASLPILNLAAILSPGQYCKKSSWSTSHHLHKGTKSGVDAAMRLVRARRELMELIRMELRTTTTTTKATRNGDHNNNGDVMMGSNSDTRKIYAVMGHGIPRGLLCHLVEMAKDWLSYHHRISDDAQSNEEANGSSTTSQITMNRQSSDNVKLAFTNTPNSMLLDQHTIRMTNASGVTTTLPSLPKEWDGDFEMYMVMMDRMASRMASLAIPSSSDNTTGDDDNVENNVDATLGTGSIVTPSQLVRWDVTITKEQTLPISLSLPDTNPLLAGGQCGGSNRRGRVKGTTRHEPILTMEWVRKENNNFSNIVLRLQDDDAENNLQDGSRDPITLVFDGEYVAP